MGKATKWLKGLLRMKKEKEFSDRKLKKRWSFGRLSKDSGEIPAEVSVMAADSSLPLMISYVADSEKEQSKHAIAVAAATAAAADAAMAAAQAAVAVVELTSQGKGSLLYGKRENWAAAKIQTFFRGYLARKALRALKGIVKLQALVRGFLVRKRAVATLYSMQALIRAQAAARSQRFRLSVSNDPRFVADTRARKSIERFGFVSRRMSYPYEQSINGMDESPKIVEIDTYKLRSRSNWRINIGMSDSGDDQSSLPISTPPPYQITGRLSIPDGRHLRDSDWSFLGDDSKFATAHNTPRSKGSGRFNAPLTPARSITGDSTFRPYSNSPSYMANTQSFNAKVRSHSAPKQRPEAGPVPWPKKRLSLNEIMASRSSFSGVRMHKSHYQVEQKYGF